MVIWYFGLEPLKERYTEQLCQHWMPPTFDGIKFYDLTFNRSDQNQIKTGQVLDAVDRGTYALQQCERFLDAIADGSVKDGDVIYLQDFWTPGIESIFYALDLHGIRVRLYSMLHAQSVDEYDFTYKMRGWMRYFELGIAERHDGIFVASTIHREQLKAAGFNCPIHVLGLPINILSFTSEVSCLLNTEKKRKVIFTSRLDKEKNPYFMMAVAKDFLWKHHDWVWVVTTSADEFRSNHAGVIDALHNLAAIQPRFILRPALSKAQYYQELAESRFQFNSSLQDYVSWTLLEAVTLDCQPVYPNFRSFCEILPRKHLYDPFIVRSAIRRLDKLMVSDETLCFIAEKCDVGRKMIKMIIKYNLVEEYNLWHEYELIESLIYEDFSCR